MKIGDFEYQLLTEDSCKIFGVGYGGKALQNAAVYLYSRPKTFTSQNVNVERIVVLVCKTTDDCAHEYKEVDLVMLHVLRATE